MTRWHNIRLDEDLHTTSESQDEVKGGFLLNVYTSQLTKTEIRAAKAYYNQKGSFRPRAAFQRKSIAVDLEECPPCLGSWT